MVSFTTAAVIATGLAFTEPIVASIAISIATSYCLEEEEEEVVALVLGSFAGVPTL